MPDLLEGVVTAWASLTVIIVLAFPDVLNPAQVAAQFIFWILVGGCGMGVIALYLKHIASKNG